MNSIFTNSKILRFFSDLIATKTSFANSSQSPEQFSNLNNFKLENFSINKGKSLDMNAQSPISKCTKVAVTGSKDLHISLGNDLMEVND